MNLLPGKIQFRIIGLLSLIIVLFLAGLAVMKNAELQRLDLLEQNAASERQSHFDKLLALKGQPLKTYVFDYSYWDELVDFVRNRDPEWARINLDEALTSQKLAAAWVYNADFEPLYVSRKPAPRLPPAGPVPPAVLRGLSRDQPFLHFFIETPLGLLEIRSAPIQPSADTERRTPAQGYLLVGQFWDAEYLQSLSDLIGGIVTLQPASAAANNSTTPPIQDDLTEFTRTLPGPAGEPAVFLTIRHESAFGRNIRQSLAEEHYLFIAFSLLLLAAMGGALFFWVSRPLRLLSDSLARRDPAILGPLVTGSTEFGQLARLARDFFEQQQRLTEEIQERRQREVILHQYSRALEHSANLVVITDRQGAIEYVNPKFVQVTGYSEAEVIGANPRLLKSGETPAEEYQRLWRTILDGGEWHGEFHNRRKDGTLYWESAAVAPIRDEHGAITHFVAIKEDITAHKLVERRIVRLSQCYAALSRTSAAIMRHGEPEELFQRICQIVVDLEQIRLASIGFADPDSRWFQSLAQAGAAPDYSRLLADRPASPDPGLPEGWGPTGMAFRLGEPVVSNDFLADPNNRPWLEPASALGIRAAAAFPLRRGGRVVGCLSAYAAERDFFEADITGLLTSLAGEISFALDLFEREAQRRAAEERISHMASHDPLTGLPNRALLLDRLNQAIHGAGRRQRCVGVLFLDLDHFKTINDSLGHEIGDQLLKAVTERLRNRLRREDTLARQGGDEFLVVLPDIAEPAISGQVAESLLEALRAPFLLGGHQLHINVSIGISTFPLDAADPSTLIRFADNAMYQAKAAGRGNYTFFTPELNDRTSRRLLLGNELWQALDREEFVLHYQPLVDLATGRLAGVEALIHWQHPQRGLLPPGVFLPVAEETGLIDPIGAWTLREACAQNRRWRDAGLCEIPVAVNLSPKQWQQPQIEDHVLQALESSGLTPSLLELEISESLLPRGTDKIFAIMDRLRACGVRFAVDDFGIGHFSMGYLRRFPVNRLKIDRSIVGDISADAENAAIATTIIHLGRSLRLQVVAAGVETPEQARLLREWGCDAAQGHHFGGPLPAGECEALLARLAPAA